jgi:hypothetical protein
MIKVPAGADHGTPGAAEAIPDDAARPWSGPRGDTASPPAEQGTRSG